MAILAVTISGVRGIRQPVSFALRGKSLLLHGDNGTGKSSFERALRWALRGEDEPTADAAFTTEESFRRHVKSQLNDPLVAVEFTDGSTITVRPGTLQTSGNGAFIREACVAGQPFLRRSELLTVLGARPGDRFAYFETFLGLQKVDQLIEEISARRSALQARLTTLATALDSALEPLRSLLPSKLGGRRSLGDVLAASKEWARDLSLQTDSIADQVKELQARTESLASGDTAAFPYRLEEVGSVLYHARNSIEQSSSIVVGLLSREEQVRSAVTDPADVELLTHALEHFRRVKGETCPICQQNVDWASTRNALQLRVKALDEYSRIQREVVDLTVALRETASSTQTALAQAASIAGKLGVAEAYPFSLTSEFNAVASSSQTSLVAYLRSADTTATLGAMIAASVRWAADVIQLRDLVPDTRDLPELQTAMAFYQRLTVTRPGAELARSEVEALEKESRTLEIILEALRRSRQDVAKETLTAIEGRVSEYYLKIHPAGTDDDATGAPSIDVQRHGRGTAFVRGEFGGTEIKDPTWVYSDGHLDTVGLCIFLALRRFRSDQQGDPKLLVLDDVIISIDLGHSRRFLDLLKNAFDDHQVLILTHNGLFAHWCRTLLPGLTRLEIKSWSLSGGPQVGDYASARERIDEALKDGTAKEIAVALMELLDEWTAEARYEYQVAVPAKPGEQYTLTDIWAPLVARLRAIAKSLKSDLGGVADLLEELKDVPQVRNALAGHHNDFAQEYPRGVISKIAGDACKLVDALYCQVCTAFVVPIGDRSNPSLMECPKRHKQYVAQAATAT
jgi:hypothetical protein